MLHAMSKFLILKLNETEMKKTMVIIAIIGFLLLSSSAGTERYFKTAEGLKAPSFEMLASDGTVVSTSDFAGRFVIVNFWASNDAGSRMAAKLYNGYVESVGEEQVSLLSVNFDSNRELVNEIVRRDNLSARSQFDVQSKSSIEDILDKFDMHNGLKSFLLNPEGRILAINPSVATIASVVGK